MLTITTIPDGTTDNTAAFQAKVTELPQYGGKIFVPAAANPYRVSKVDINKPNIHFELEQGAVIKKFGSGGTSSRGIFTVANFVKAYFRLTGGTIDLNGQGPKFLSEADRIPNNYAVLNNQIPEVKGINGPANAAVFALRATHIVLDRVVIKNSGESGILFRNCSDTEVSNCTFENLANYGVEWSYPAAVNDGGTGQMPDLSRNYVRDCGFKDINDYALGVGNGVGVGGGGVPESNPRDHEVTGCTMIDCQRDVSLELPFDGKYFEGGRIELRSYGALQGSVSLVNARGFDVDLIARNPGAAPTAALLRDASQTLRTAGGGYGDIYGFAISGAESNDNQVNVDVVDDRNTRVYRETDGQISSASPSTFTSLNASFVDGDIGRWIGILGAGPDGTCLHARIVTRVSANQVTIDNPATNAVTGAPYAYGGALRYGVKINSGGDVLIAGRVKGGIASGLPSEPDAAGLYLASHPSPFIGPFGLIDTSNLSVLAPATLGNLPAGVRLAGALTGSGKFRPGGMRVRGFSANFVGTRVYEASVESRTFRSREK